MQLLHAGAHGVGLLLALGGGLGQQVGHRHGHHHPVDRLARAAVFEQAHEAGPGLVVGLVVTVLGGVAAGGVDQHGLIGEPPVAIAGAGYAGYTLGTTGSTRRGGERKAQP